MKIIPYGKEHEPQVAAFNQRLGKEHERYRFPESAVPAFLPNVPGRPVYEEYYLLIGDGGAVHGAYVLKHQPFCAAGNNVTAVEFRLPVSEGIANPKYAFAGLQIVRDALSRAKPALVHGIGGMDQPLAKLLAANRFTIYAIPFYFRVVDGFAFCRNIYLRGRTYRRVLLDVLAFSGLASAGAVAAHSVKGLAALTASPRGLAVEKVGRFDAWADDLWEAGKGEYGFTAVRNADVLNTLYPSDPRFIKLKVAKGGKAVGWAVVLNTRMSGHRYFGNMQVGSIVDCFAPQERAFDVIHAADRWLRGVGAQLIVSNQMHRAWGTALSRMGYFNGSSNLLLAVSPELRSTLGDGGQDAGGYHFNRGDGDGPINL